MKKMEDKYPCTKDKSVQCEAWDDGCTVKNAACPYAPATRADQSGSVAGYDELWSWFGLSYASWITIPRVLAHEMPDEWQRKMAELLNKYDATFTNQPDLGTRVQITKNNKLAKTPEWLLNYRHPDKAFIHSMKNVKDT